MADKCGVDDGYFLDGQEAAINSKITIVDHSYYQQNRLEPACHIFKYAQIINSDEQVYERNTRIDSEWSILDTGWVESPELVIIKNRAGENLQKVPTEEEKSRTLANLILLSFDGKVPHLFIRPGQHQRVSFLKPPYIKSIEPATPVTIIAYPG